MYFYKNIGKFEAGDFDVKRTIWARRVFLPQFWGGENSNDLGNLATIRLDMAHLFSIIAFLLALIWRLDLSIQMY